MIQDELKDQLSHSLNVWTITLGIILILCTYTVHYIHLVFLYPNFHTPIINISLHYLLLCILEPSSGSLIFNCSIIDATGGCKHLSKCVGKMQNEVLLAAIKQGSSELCDTIYVSWEATVDIVTRLQAGLYQI
jgi:hypothetical protein